MICSKIYQCIPEPRLSVEEQKGNGVHESRSAGDSAHHCVCCCPYFREYIELLGAWRINWRLSRAPHQYSYLAYHLYLPGPSSRRTPLRAKCVTAGKRL